jgi:hypothetical protein
MSRYKVRVIYSRRGLAQSLPVFLVLAVLIVSPFSVERRRLPGIWKLTSDSLPYVQDIRSKLRGLIYNKLKEDILLKLNPDGSFKQCNEGYSEGRWLVGQWTVNDDQRLVLAMRRQYFGPPFDVVLEGSIRENSTLTVEGQVQKGKFMYPPKHPAFFESPLANPESLGTFSLIQSVATFSVTSAYSEGPAEGNRTCFRRDDFYDKCFIMTIEPIEGHSSTRNKEADESLFDIRAMPIRFYRNNTFQAYGTNKILRGRFEVTNNDELVFEVSIFGMGRSISGSVYSEGLGLTHEDERSYAGSIEETEGKIRVQGTVVFGNDMGTDARPEPVGIFIMTETSSNQAGNPILVDDVPDGGFGIFE